jgi:hypothetical protein
VQLAIGVDIEDPGILIERLPELPSLVVVETVNVELRNANGFIVVVGSRGHGDLQFIPEPSG